MTSVRAEQAEACAVASGSSCVQWWIGKALLANEALLYVPDVLRLCTCRTNDTRILPGKQSGQLSMTVSRSAHNHSDHSGVAITRSRTTFAQ
jgi:hypothetical protein